MAAFSAVYPVNCTKIASPIKLHKIGGNICKLCSKQEKLGYLVAEYVLLQQYCTYNQVLYVYYVSLLPTHQILQLPNPHPTLKKSKINFNQCNFVNIHLLKTVSHQIFQKLQQRDFLKKCKYRNFSSHTHNIYSLLLFLFQSNKISCQFFQRN